MHYEDCSLYLYAEDPTWQAPEKLIDFLLEMNEDFDYIGSPDPVFYNGMGGFSDKCHMDFESKADYIKKHMKKFLHHSISFLDWHKDELLRNIAEDFEDVSAGKEDLYVGDVSFILGEHELLTIETKVIVKSQFSFAFYCLQAPKDNMSRLTKALRADDEFMQHFGEIETAVGTTLNFLIGPA